MQLEAPMQQCWEMNFRGWNVLVVMLQLASDSTLYLFTPLAVPCKGVFANAWAAFQAIKKLLSSNDRAGS